MNRSLIAEIILCIENLSLADLDRLSKWLDREIAARKKESVARLLLEDANRSDRSIAVIAGVSAPFVAKVRRELIASQKLDTERFSRSNANLPLS